MITIDHVKPVVIDESVGGNELNTLNYLSTGLSVLYNGVCKYEQLLQEKERSSGSKMWGFGNLPDLPPGAVHMLPCFFHWFGVSIINYVRLVGFLEGLSTGKYTRASLKNDSNFALITNNCDAYVDSIAEIADVKVWRDKVAAHFAITAPRKNQDNSVFLDYSVIYPVGYQDHRFRVGVMCLLGADSLGRQQKAKLPEWSVTEAYEKLQIRYWPSRTVG